MNLAPSKQAKPGGSFCRVRSAHAGAPRPHKMTSSIKRTSPTGECLEDSQRCSWCNSPKKPRR